VTIAIHGRMFGVNLPRVTEGVVAIVMGIRVLFEKSWLVLIGCRFAKISQKSSKTSNLGPALTGFFNHRKPQHDIQNNQSRRYRKRTFEPQLLIHDPPNHRSE